MSPPPGARTCVSRTIAAPAEALYDAFLDPEALAAWMPPAEMTGQIHAFEPGVGGGYVMSLFYPSTEQVFRGKTAEREDRVRVRFVALEPPRRIVEAVTFDSPDPAFGGEMRLTATFEEVAGGTEVTMLCENLPPGLRPQDNEEGTRLSLAQLALRFE